MIRVRAAATLLLGLVLTCTLTVSAAHAQPRVTVDGQGATDWITPPFVSAADTSVLANFSFDAGPMCDPMGWTSEDLTQQYDDFAGLFPGITLVQVDPCQVEFSCVWGFFDGSPDDYTCGGFPSQAVVPFEKADTTGIFVANQIVSPAILLSGTGSEVILEFDVYRDLPVDNLVFYSWHVRSFRNAVAGPWRSNGYVHYGNNRPDWIRQRLPIGALIESGADSIQVALRVEDMCGMWCGVYGTGACHSHAPLFDHVRVVRVSNTGPQWRVSASDLLQDNFPGDGTVVGTVRADIAADIASLSSANIRPGDSMVVTVNDPEAGLGVDPMTGGAAVYGYVSVSPPQPLKTGGALIDDPTRWVVVDSLLEQGVNWYCIRMDTAYSDSLSQQPMPDRFCLDLNDGLFEPGDTVAYFLAAENASGQRTYWTEFIGATPDIAAAAAAAMEMTCLPANALSGATDILYIDGFDNRGAQPFFDNSFVLIGLTPDRYDLRDASAFLNNGPASRVADVGSQIIPHYSKIIWNTGSLPSGLIGDGTGYHRKADDFGLLFAFLDRNSSGAGLYLSGDNLAEEWSVAAGASANALRSVYMNHDLIAGDHINNGLPVSPFVIGQPGTIFDHTNRDSLIAHAGCPGIGDLDVLSATGLSVLGMTYTSDPSSGAVLYQSTANALADTVRVVLSGFSYHRIRDDKPSSIPDRVHHLLDILDYFDNVIDPPTGIGESHTLRTILSQNFPNPFNPTTRIRYTLARPSHVRLVVYNAAGQRVRVLVDESQIPRQGGFEVRWDGQNDRGEAVATGVYFYRLQAGGETFTRKAVLLK